MSVRTMLAVCASLVLVAAGGCQDKHNPVSPEPAVTGSSPAALGTAVDRTGGASVTVSLRGVIAALDTSRMVFALDTGRETMRLHVNERTEITAYGSRRHLPFARLSPGMTVGVRAVRDGGSLLARTIVVMR